MKDKREECGCHIGCHTDPHDCAVPCRWPSCLTESEAQELAGELWPQEERDSYWSDFLDPKCQTCPMCACPGME